MTFYKRTIWLGRQIVALMSNNPSYFSLKRIERFTMYGTAMYFEWQYFLLHKNTLTVQDLLSLVIPLFTMAGLSMAATQQEKKTNG